MQNIPNTHFQGSRWRSPKAQLRGTPYAPDVSGGGAGSPMRCRACLYPSSCSSVDPYSSRWRVWNSRGFIWASCACCPPPQTAVLSLGLLGVRAQEDAQPRGSKPDVLSLDSLSSAWALTLVEY